MARSEATEIGSDRAGHRPGINSEEFWGPFGPPGSAAARDYEHRHIMTIGGTDGLPEMRVRREVAPLFEALCRAAVTGLDGARPPYQLTGKNDDWGYCSRWITGRPGILSNHAGGLAVDLNAEANPLGAEQGDIPAWLSHYAQVQLGLRWGGAYQGRKDWMHFEVVESPAQVAQRLQLLGLAPASRAGIPAESAGPAAASADAVAWDWIPQGSDGRRQAPFLPPGGGGGGGGAALVPPALGPAGAHGIGGGKPGGIDLSTLELRYLAEFPAGRVIAYGFHANLGQHNGADGDGLDGAAAARQASEAFFVWLSLPRSRFTVNLNPDEPDRIVDPVFGRTDAARVLLEADLLLKTTTASMIHPDTDIGSAFWATARAGGGADSSVSGRLWIVPGEVTAFSDSESVHVIEAPLEVRMEVDYQRPARAPGRRASAEAGNAGRAEAFFRAEVLPGVVHDVNHGPGYAQLRRVYLSRVIAEWYRRRRRGEFAELVDCGDVSAWTAGPRWDAREVFDRYVELYQRGVFDLRRFGVAGGELGVFRYFQGGVDFGQVRTRQLTRSQLLSVRPLLDRDLLQALTAPQGHLAAGGAWLGGFGFPADRSGSRDVAEAAARAVTARLAGRTEGPTAAPSISTARLPRPPRPPAGG